MLKIVLSQFIIAVLAISFGATNLSAQEATKTAEIQPTIMAIPFVPKGQSLRSNFEHNELLRIAITKVKEAFDERGVNTIDFRAKLKQLSNKEVLAGDQKTTIKDDVIALSGADIYVEVEANKNYSKTGNSVTVILTAFDAFSGESLANKVSSSPKFHTDNYEKLTEKAVAAEVDNLLNTIQAKFIDIVENGRTITLNVGIEGEVDYDLDAEIDDEGSLLSDAIEDWVQENAFKNYYHLQGVTENKMIFDLIKVPLKDARGRSFRVSKFAAKFKKFLKSKGIESSRVVSGNSLVFTLK